MANNIEAIHDDATIIFPNAIKLEPYTRVEINLIRMKLVHGRQQKSVKIIEAFVKLPERLDLPDGLDHYLFW